MRFFYRPTLCSYVRPKALFCPSLTWWDKDVLGFLTGRSGKGKRENMSDSEASGSPKTFPTHPQAEFLTGRCMQSLQAAPPKASSPKTTSCALYNPKEISCSLSVSPASWELYEAPPSSSKKRFRGNSHTTFHPFLGLLDSFLCNVLGAFEEMIMTSGYFPSFMTKHGATMPWQASHRIWGWTAVTNTDGLLWHRP